MFLLEKVDRLDQEINDFKRFIKDCEVKINKKTQDIADLTQLVLKMAKLFDDDMAFIAHRYKDRLPHQAEPNELIEGAMLQGALSFCTIMGYSAKLTSEFGNYVQDLLLESGLKVDTERPLHEIIEGKDSFERECVSAGIVRPTL